MRTIAWGAIPIALLAAAVSIDHIPGTGIDLTVPYAAEGPGPTVDTLGQVEGTDVVEIDEPDGAANGAPQVEQPKGQLNMTTVSVRTNMTLAQAIARWLTTDDTIVPIDTVIPQNQTPEQVNEANAQAFTQSESAATVAAMSYLGLPVHIVVAGVLDDTPAKGLLEEDDIVTKVDGHSVTKPEEAQSIIRAKKPGDEVEITWTHEGQEHTEKVTLGENPHDKSVPMLGILMSSAPDAALDVKYNLQDIGGPSAGMMFTLAVIDKLSTGDLTGGHFVAGTGTISEDGTVGAIGGIVHKVRAARDAGAELFLAPADNCAEAMSRDTGSMVVAKVSTLQDAVTAMDAFSKGEPVNTCQPS